MLDSNQRKTVLQTARIAALAMPLIGWARSCAHPVTESIIYQLAQNARYCHVKTCVFAHALRCTPCHASLQCQYNAP